MVQGKVRATTTRTRPCHRSFLSKRCCVAMLLERTRSGHTATAVTNARTAVQMEVASGIAKKKSELEPSAQGRMDSYVERAKARLRRYGYEAAAELAAPLLDVKDQSLLQAWTEFQAYELHLFNDHISRARLYRRRAERAPNEAKRQYEANAAEREENLSSSIPA